MQNTALDFFGRCGLIIAKVADPKNIIMDNQEPLGPCGSSGIMRAPTREEECDRLKEPLHIFRKQIDACIKQVEDFNSPLHSHVYFRESDIVKTKLQEAKMWVGKCIEKLGSELPKEFQDKAE